MDVLQKAKRIKALVDYTEYKANIVPLNYSLNNMLDSNGKTYFISFESIYNNEYKVWEDIYKTTEEVLLGMINNDPTIVEPEQYEKIVSDVYAQLYTYAYAKANKKAIEKITIAEIELHIKKYEQK